MSEAKYTSGPWSRMDNDLNVWSPAGAVCQRPKITGSMSSAKNWEANARLIAAAPELLEACEKALWNSLDLPEHVRILLQSAIAKALGTENAN